jgi:uncharacterized protein YegJ (DUF2314 family)
MKVKRTILICILAWTLVSGCSLLQGEDVVKREGEPDVYRIASEDEDMNAAIEQAQATLDTFVEFLNSPKPGQTHFSIKAKFATTDEPASFEHIWLYDVEYDGEQFSGRIGNQPLDATYLNLDEKVKVPREDVSDWMIIEDGVLLGGYTLRVLVDRMSAEEKETFLESIDFEIPDEE